MASPKKILVLDLGMQNLRLAEFSVSTSGELQLLRGARREFLLDPAMEQTRPEQTRIALQEILGEWGLRRGDVTCVLPAHTVFTRVVPLELPEGLEGDLQDVIQFEAQQNIPFPLNEVVWDYAIMGESTAGAQNVVFVAVKTNLLEQLCGAILSAGLRVLSIKVAPLALYDAFRNTYPEMAEETTLLLDIGSRTSNMVIASPSSFFSRSIPSGGLTVTSAIAKDIGADLEVAEQLKISQGSIALGPSSEAIVDPLEENLARIARQVLIKTQADISRSLSYHRTTLGGSPPSRVLITGGTSALHHLREFLAEKLQRDVSPFNPLRGIPLEEAEHSTAASFINENSNNLGELIGGALGSTSSPHTKLEILPPSLVRKRDLAKRLPFLVGAGGIFLILLISVYAFFLHATRVIKNETQNISAEVTEKNRIYTEMRQILTKVDAVQATGNQLLSLLSLRQVYPSMLADLNARVPDRFLWITDLQPDTGVIPKGLPGSRQTNASVKAIILKGLYLDNPREATVIDDFVTNLESSTVFAVDENSKSKIITQRGSPNGDFWAYPFALKLPLRNPISILP